MRPRIADELALLRRHYGDVEHAEVAGEDWFKLPRYSLPPGWRVGNQEVAEVPIVFLVTSGYPGALPYGFMAPTGLNLNGTATTNTGASPKTPPFPGEWVHFSWTVENWNATADISKGSNLLGWARGFAHRFKDGA